MCIGFQSPESVANSFWSSTEKTTVFMASEIICPLSTHCFMAALALGRISAIPLSTNCTVASQGNPSILFEGPKGAGGSTSTKGAISFGKHGNLCHPEFFRCSSQQPRTIYPSMDSETPFPGSGAFCLSKQPSEWCFARLRSGF